MENNNMDRLTEETLKLSQILSSSKVNNNELIEYVVDKSKSERQLIKDKYSRISSEKLPDIIKRRFSGNFKKVLLGLFETPLDFDTKNLYNALSGLMISVDCQCLIDIICTKSNKELEEIKENFARLYREDLKQLVYSKTTGKFKILLSKLLECKRNENTEIDELKCKELSDNLYKAGEAKLGTNDEVFIDIFSQSSVNELLAIEKYYNQSYGHSLIVAVKEEFSTDIKDALIAILSSTFSKKNFYIDQIYNSIEGAGTNDSRLIRTIISREEIDLKEINEDYETIKGRGMINDIKGDTSGSYEDILVALCEKGLEKSTKDILFPTSNKKDKVFTDYKSKYDEFFEKMESKKELNYLNLIDFNDYAYALSTFVQSQGTSTVDYSGKNNMVYSKYSEWFNESFQNYLWQTFIENKLFTHPNIMKIYDNHMESLNIFRDVLLDMYKSLDQKLNQFNKENGKQKDVNRIKKFHLIGFGLLYCQGIEFGKIKLIFDLFKNKDDNLLHKDDIDEFKDFLLSLFLIPSYCSVFVRVKQNNCKEIGGLFSNDNKDDCLECLKLANCVNLVKITCEKIFKTSTTIDYNEFRSLFINKNDIPYLISCKGIRQMLSENSKI